MKQIAKIPFNTSNSIWWVQACAQLQGLQLWHHIDTNHPENGEKVKAMITEKMKVEALRNLDELNGVSEG